MGKLPFQIGSLVFMLALTYFACVHEDLFFAIVGLVAVLVFIVATSLGLADMLYDVYVRRKSGKNR